MLPLIRFMCLAVIAAGAALFWASPAAAFSGAIRMSAEMSEALKEADPFTQVARKKKRKLRKWRKKRKRYTKRKQRRAKKIAKRWTPKPQSKDPALVFVSLPITANFIRYFPFLPDLPYSPVWLNSLNDVSC